MSARPWIDRRAAFARRLHALGRQRGIDPAEWFALPDGELDDAGSPLPATREAPRHTLIVPGLLGLSLRSIVAPLVCARGELAPAGYRVDVAWVSGRANCANNGRALRERVLAAADAAGEPVNVIGYSKGCADALHMLGAHADTHAAVHALVSLGGVVHGTPLAENVPAWLRFTLRHLPIPGEARGDPNALDDLTRARRERWLRDHPLPESVRYASVVATPDPARVSRVLRASWRRLARIDPRNDSQVLCEDAILPGGELLARVDADHWALALPIAERHPRLARWLVDRNAFPRTLLLQALIDHLDAPAS